MKASRILITLLMAVAVAALGCKPKGTTGGDTASPAEEMTTTGIDTEAKVVKIGALNDESGPAATIGKPYALGKRILAEQVNAGGSGILPDGWKIELVERDHGYNSQKSVTAYNEIKDQVAFIWTSFGTPNTLPLQAYLERDKMVAFPASLSSEMAKHHYTPPTGPSYEIEAMRAMDWVVEQAGDASKVKAGIIYQQDDYGQDGLRGWVEAAEHHGVEIVAQQAITPGQPDMTAPVNALKEKGATHILLTTLPSATGPILGTAAKLKYMPTWIGNTPSWIDGFFSPKVIPSAVFTNFYWVQGLPYWGEDVPGMADFITAYETYGKDKHHPDFYIMVSYLQGRTALEAFNATLDGTPSRESFYKSLTSLKGYDAGGMIQPIDLTAFPYEAGTKTRILKPDFENMTWKVVSDYAEAQAHGTETTASADEH